MRRLVLPLMLLTGLSACGGDSMSDSTPAAAPPPAAVSFTAFVLGLLQNQSDSAAPLMVNAAQFTFADDDNPAAFATVLGP